MSPTNPPVRAAVYARVSSDQQVQDHTIASQIEALQERLRGDGMVLDPELSFIDDGWSGATLVRPDLDRLRDLAALGLIERLYVFAPDRLSRRHAYQVLLLEELRRDGVEVIFLDHAPRDTAEDRLLLEVQGIVAEYERAQITERCRRGKLHAARHGAVNVLGAAPYGYRYVPARGSGEPAAYEIVLEQARVVRQIFTWVGRDRLSLREVCRRLQNQGIGTATGQSWWNHSTIWGLLQNPAYQGQAAYGKTRRGPRRPHLRPQRGDPVSPPDYSVYPVRRANRSRSPFPPWWSRNSSRPSRSNCKRIAAANGSGVTGDGICWRACWSAGPVGTPTTANRSTTAAPAVPPAAMPTTVVSAVTPVTAGDSGCVGTGRSASSRWKRRCGRTCVRCSKSPNGSPVNTNAV
jgi:site-specific DNA recombinase